jgi:hypothetical protein
VSQSDAPKLAEALNVNAGYSLDQGCKVLPYKHPRISSASSRVCGKADLPKQYSRRLYATLRVDGM